MSFSSRCCEHFTTDMAVSLCNSAYLIYSSAATPALVTATHPDTLFSVVGTWTCPANSLMKSRKFIGDKRMSTHPRKLEFEQFQTRGAKALGDPPHLISWSISVEILLGGVNSNRQSLE
jgi:hypothetical protein